MTPLKPCPFCGAAAELNVFYEDDTINVPDPICDVEFVVVRCPSCGISKQNRYRSDAVHWWNKRSAEPRYEALRVAMRKIAWPIMALREFAESQGHGLDGHKAVEIANSAAYLTSIAQDAMAEIAAIDPTGVSAAPAQSPQGSETP